MAFSVSGGGLEGVVALLLEHTADEAISSGGQFGRQVEEVPLERSFAVLGLEAEINLVTDKIGQALPLVHHNEVIHGGDGLRSGLLDEGH